MRPHCALFAALLALLPAGAVVAAAPAGLDLAAHPAADDHGYGPDQQFFIAFAQSWQRAVREPALRLQVVTDSHAPDEYRGDTVRNLEPWFRALAVRPGARLYLADDARVSVW